MTAGVSSALLFGGEEPFPGFWEAETPLKKPQDQWGSLQNIKSVSAAPQQIIDIGDEELFPGFHSEEELPLIRTSYGQSKKVGSDPFLTGFGAEKEWDKSSELFASQVQNIMKGYNDPVADYTKVAGKGIITNPNSDYFQEHLDELIPAEENVNIGIAKKELNKILDTQYPIAMDFPEAQYLAGSADVTAAIANNRLNQAVETIIDHKLSIYRYANEFNIPPEIIGSIILKEQYTRSIPDWLGNITTPIGKILPDSLMKNKYIGKAFGSHSTGLGAVFASTARDAWNFCVGKKEANRILPEDNYALQVKLAQDPDFNIKTICAVLKHKAAQIGEDLDHATKDRWISILTAYNGGSEYGPKTIEYVPYVKSILENSVW